MERTDDLIVIADKGDFRRNCWYRHPIEIISIVGLCREVAGKTIVAIPGLTSKKLCQKLSQEYHCEVIWRQEKELRNFRLDDVLYATVSNKRSVCKFKFY